MADKILKNGQITKIKARNLEMPAHIERFDSTLDERERNYDTTRPEPRFTEYR